jgi:acyl dehydratase
MWAVTEGPDGPEGRRTQGTVRFGPAYQGPPGHAHGAMVAAMYDDLLGRSQLGAGFTGSITIRFLAPTPLDRDLDVRAWVDRTEGRKRWVHGTCHLDGRLLTEAEGLFIAPKGGATLEGIVGALGG